MRYSIVRLSILLFFLFQLVVIKAQTGSEFWFAAPDVSYEHFNNSVPLNLHITALYNTHVVVSRPADPEFVPLEFDLNSQQSELVRLDAILDVSDIEVYSRDIFNPNFLQNKGFKVEAFPGEVTAYYEMEGRNNTDIVSLKSNNALGKDFWVSTQRKYNNHGYADDFSGFVVVATEDGTVVNIDPNGNNLHLHGSAPFSVTLNKGQAFSVRAAGQAAADHIHGIRVTSNKNIAISIFDDSMQIDDGGGNWDIFADQIVPVELVGSEYVVVKGEVQDELANTSDGEAIFFTSTEDNTEIFIDGVFIHVMLLAGDYWSYDIKNLATHIRTSAPVYINHITGYSTDVSGSRELGGAILPSMDHCTGSNSVTVKRTLDPGFVFLNNLVVRNDTVSGSSFKNQAVSNFTFSINGGSAMPINPDHFTYIMDSSFAVYDRIKAGDEAYFNLVGNNDILQVENSVALFHLGVMEGKQSPGCKYGYFSDYAQVIPRAGIGGTQNDYNMFCSLDSVQLVASGGISYQWSCPFAPENIDYLSATNIAAPWFHPPEEGLYEFEVNITGNCFSDATLQIQIIHMEPSNADFSINEKKACGELTTTITNLSNPIFNENMIWEFENPYEEINQDTIPMSFERSFPQNNSDTVQYYPITLHAIRQFFACPSEKRDTVTILPGLKADFQHTVTKECNSMDVAFTNISLGTIDSVFWYSGTGEQSTDFDPVFTYNYDVNTDTTIVAQMVVSSLSGCKDSAVASIRVIPDTVVQLIADKWEGCSPLQIDLEVSATEELDSIFWHFQYADGTIEMFKDSLNLGMNFINTSGQIDTIDLFVSSNTSLICSRRVKEQIILYPEINAEFAMNKHGNCSPLEVQFENLSSGATSYFWDFGNQETSEEVSPSIIYNTGEAGKQIYKSMLIASAPLGCPSDTAEMEISVTKPGVLKISMPESSGCSPLEMELSGVDNSDPDSLIWFGFYPEELDSVMLEANGTYYFEHQNLGDINDTIPIMIVPWGGSGCTTSLDTFLVVYPEVTADFYLNYLLIDFPYTISTVNTSSNASSYIWDLGDGTFSYDENTEHSYIVSRDTVFIVHLTAESEHCSDTAYEEVEVNAPLQISDLQSDRNAIKAYFESSNSQLVIENYGEPAKLNGVSVYTLSGSLVQGELVNQVLQEGEPTYITLNSLSSGNLYIVILYFDDQNFIEKIFYP